MMRRIAMSVVCGFCLLFGGILGAETNPKAVRAACVIAGSARFTVLTDRLIRMEYAPDGHFEDRASLTFVNRALPVPTFKSTPSSTGGVTIETGALTLVYGGGDFTSETLSATFRDSAGAVYTWHFGDSPRENLLGTTRTLDGVSGPLSLMPRMELGLVSRAGWALVDDTTTPVFVKGRNDQWVAPRAAGSRDFYLFAYGHDYRAALGDFTRVAGRIPLPPRWVLGYWWSRYWQYSDAELKDLVTTIREQNLPMDVLIVDMDWHETWGLGENGGFDEFGQLVGWTGYTWQKSLFPDPVGFLDWCHRANLKTALNLHPASGIQPQEKCYADFCRDYGWKDLTRAVPFKMEEEKWATSYFKTVLSPLEKEGVDFWWLDWQQWLEAKTMPELSNTFWLNHVFSRHATEAYPSRRPLIYHRWGGLGSHRYQVGFSGDTSVNWDVLGLLPWFTATAANVGYGYWGHDIGGHHEPKGLGKDPELFTRWLQSGVFMPIFRTHSSRDASIERRIWQYPEHRAVMKAAFDLRYELAPYIYTAARQAYETGVSLCRPLYYDWPECETAYDRTLSELAFGDDILAVTVPRATDPITGLAEVAFWLPKGIWYDAARGEGVTVTNATGEILRRAYTIAENPYFVRAGAVIPKNPSSVRNLASATGAELVLDFIPGADAGEGRVYEDAGDNCDYATAYADTRIQWKRDEKTIRAEIAPRKGTYPSAVARRSYTLRFPGRLPPAQVVLNGEKLAYARTAAQDTWTFEGTLPGVVVHTAARPVEKEIVVELRYASAKEADETALAGIKGLVGRFAALTPEMKAQYGRHVNYMAMLPSDYLTLACLSSVLTAEPEKAQQHLEEFQAARERFAARFASDWEPKLDADFAARVKAQVLTIDPAEAATTGGRLLAPRVTFASVTPGGESQPAFSWQTEFAPGRSQQAYRLRVMRETGADAATVWDSGVVFDVKGFAMPYEGPALEKGTTYRWEVSVRDEMHVWTDPVGGTFVAGTLPDACVAVYESGEIESRCAEVASLVQSAAAVKTISIGYEGEIFRLHAAYAKTGDRRFVTAAWPQLCARVASDAASGSAPLSRLGAAGETLEPETRALLCLAAHVRDCWLMKELAACLGDKAAGEKFVAWENAGRAAFKARFLDEKGFLKATFTSPLALASVLRLRFLKPGSDAKDDLIKRLVDGMTRSEFRAPRQELADVILLDALAADAGRPDLAVTVLLRTANEAEGFAPAALPAVTDWIRRTLGGIDLGDLRQEPGFKKFVLAPKPDRRLGDCSVIYETPYGAVGSSWRYTPDGTWQWRFTVPSNSRANVTLPNGVAREYGPGTHEVSL